MHKIGQKPKYFVDEPVVGGSTLFTVIHTSMKKLGYQCSILKAVSALSDISVFCSIEAFSRCATQVWPYYVLIDLLGRQQIIS